MSDVPPSDENVDELINAQRERLSSDATNLLVYPTFNIYHQPLRQIYVDPEDLRKRLKEQAKTNADHVSTPVHLERVLKAVPLQITVNPVILQPDEQGHFSYRRDLKNIYVFDSEEEFSCDSLFVQAEKNAKKIASRQHEDEDEIQKFVKKHGRIVAIVGQAGIGKTTFLRSLVKKICLNTFRGLQASFIFFINVRNLSFSSKPKNLLQALLQSILPNWKHEPDKDKAILEWLAEDPNVLIALDGVDEADVKDCTKPVPSVNMFEEAETWSFLVNLISGNLLPLAHKIITSRPNQLYSLHASHRPHFLAEILGIDSAGQEGLGKQICGNKYDEVKSYLDENDNLQALCYIPVNCILVYAFLMNEKNALHSANFTRVLAFTCNQYVRTDHARDGVELIKLAKFAWKTFSTRKFVFYQHDLSNGGLGESTVQAFLHTSVVGVTDLQVTIFEGDKQSYFSHMILHEFFAAIYLVYLMSDEEFHESLLLLKSDRFEVVGKFAFGLLNRDVHSTLRPLFRFSLDDLFKRKDRMKQFVVKEIVIRDEISLKYLSFVYESHDDDITRAVVEVLSNYARQQNLKLASEFFPTDSGSLAYLLQFTPSSTLDLRGCHFQGESLHRFAQLVQMKKIKIQCLFVNSSSLENSFPLAPCVDLIEEICLNSISAGISHSIANLPQPIKLLNFFGNELSNEGASLLGHCIHKIKRLNLESCKLTSIDFLAQSIAALHEPMELLNLAFNNIGNNGVTSLAQCVHRIHELNLWHCQITRIETFTQSISRLQKPMKSLTLTDNKIGNDGMSALACCIHRVEWLNLTLCGITDLGPLAQGLAFVSQPLKYICLEGNKIGNHGAMQLAGCVSHIEELNLTNCGIKDIEPLAQSIKRLQQPMKKITLTLNPIRDAGAFSLTQCMKKIGTILLYSCDFTNDGEEAIRRKIKELNLAGLSVDVHMY